MLDYKENLHFAEHGLEEAEISRLIDASRSHDWRWNDHHNMKAAYFAGDDVFRLARDAYSAFHGDNLLYGKVLYPSLLEMSSDVVAMALELLGAGDRAGGTLTSGGTESIILAVKTARDWAAAERPTPSRPEILVGHTCHAAFNKAADLMGLKVVRLPPTASFKIEPDVMRAHVTASTIMVVGSAPAYPVGCIDPISDIAAIACEKNLWMHVDACVGGFFLPFAKELDQLPPFDFSVKGVRSMSADLHKYGYTSRGASLILLADRRDETYQRFFFDDWPTGEFVTTTLAGSRPGGAVASAWTVMKYLGRKGYRQRVADIIHARRAIIAAIGEIEELCILGEPLAGIIGISGRSGIDMRAVRQGMMDRGWRFAPLVEPVGLNILLNYTHGGVVDELVGDLKASILDTKAGLSPKTFVEDRYGA